MLVVGLILQACGGSAFEGRIRYQASIAGEAAQLLEPILRAQNPGFTLQQKDDKVRIDDAARIIIVDYGLDSVYVLFQADSSYPAMRLKDGAADSLPKLTVTPLPDKRESAGYTCTGKRATYNQAGRTYDTKASYLLFYCVALRERIKCWQRVGCEGARQRRRRCRAPQKAK